MILGSFSEIPQFFVQFLQLFDKIVWKIKIKHYLCTIRFKQRTYLPNLIGTKVKLKIFTTMKSRMTYRLYKDEFSPEFVYQLEKDQIEGLMATDESSEKVLVISGDVETLEKLGDIMFVNDEQKIKQVFPSFITMEDHEKTQKEIFSKMRTDLVNNLCKMISLSNNTRHNDTEEFKLMREMFFMMDNLATA